MRHLGIAIPTYNRGKQTLAAFEKVYIDAMVSSVTLMDDASDDDTSRHFLNDISVLLKMNVRFGGVNFGCYFNKRNAIAASSAEWNVLLDSDNVVDMRYLNALQALPHWSPDVLYLPVFAEPIHDYRAYEGLCLSKDTIGPYIDRPRFLTALNTGNLFVHRETFIKVFDPTVQPLSADSLYFVYCWLASGRNIFFVPGMHYHHSVGGPSNYVWYAERSRHIFTEIENRMRHNIWNSALFA